MIKNRPDQSWPLHALTVCLLLVSACQMTWAADFQIIYSNDIRGELEACG